MYEIALEVSIESELYTKEELEKIDGRFCRVVGSIILLNDPLSISELNNLLCAPRIGSQETIKESLDCLRAVIDVPSEGRHPVRILHLSFRDFLLHPERCKNQRFQIDKHKVHKQLFLDFIELMSQSLDRDLCSLCPGTLRSEIPRERIDQELSLALQYACRYWVNHVRSRHPEDHELLYKFLKKHALHWLVVMSVVGRITEAIQMITELVTKLAGQAHLWDFLRDLQRFMVNFLHVVATAPYQVYISALIFSPKESIIREVFINDVPHWIMIKTNTVDIWNSCRSTLEGHSDRVCTVVFSPDGLTVASGSWDSKLWLWDTQTGECRSTLEGHSNVVDTVVFSPDGQIVASGSWDSTVRLWDTQTGRSLKRHETSSATPKIAFSPECNRPFIDGVTLPFTPPVNQPDRLLRKVAGDDGETNFSIHLDKLSWLAPSHYHSNCSGNSKRS